MEGFVMPLKPNQERAIKKLQAAFLSCARAGVATGCEVDNFLAAPYDDEFRALAGKPDGDSIHALMDHSDSVNVRTYGNFFGGGAA
jgi:hypothetical protein